MRMPTNDMPLTPPKVKCDDDNNPPESIEEGKLNAEIEVADSLHDGQIKRIQARLRKLEAKTGIDKRSDSTMIGKKTKREAREEGPLIVLPGSHE